MEKKDLTTLTRGWLKDFLHRKYSDTYEILDVVTFETNLSKLPNAYIKSCANYSAWEFRPDVLGIMRNKKSNKVELALLNRSINALSLKEIGEIYCYSKLVNSKISFLISSEGVSNELNVLLVEDRTRDRLLNYSNDGRLIICSWDQKQNTIDRNSIIPFNQRNFILG